MSRDLEALWKHSPNKGIVGKLNDAEKRLFVV